MKHRQAGLARHLKFHDWQGWALGSASALSLVVALPANAQTARPEAVTRAMLSIERGCPITAPLDDAQRAARPARMLPILGALVAGVAGNLVTSGINALGNALEAASQEKAFVGEGVGSFTAYRIDNGGKPTDKWRTIPDLEVEVLPDGEPGPVPDGTTPETAERCLMLVIPANAAAKGKAGAPALTAANLQAAFSASGISQKRAVNAEARLKALGLTELPALYIEAELVAASDGMAIKPVLIRYAAPMPGAPKGTTATELDVSFALPGAPDTADIGTVYALARMPLPKMMPGAANDTAATVLNRSALEAYASVVVPMRATTGSADTALTARNGAVTAIDTKKAEMAQLKEALRLAQRKLDQNHDASKTQELTNARYDANLAYTDAIAVQAKLIQAAHFDVLLAGSTNVKARFLVIRDANQFGLALAKALKAQADATGKAVTDKLTPQAAWTTQDTAYVDAENAVKAAQRAVDDAITAGETSKVPGLQDAVTSAKAKANEAAVASRRQLPYAILP